MPPPDDNDDDLPDDTSDDSGDADESADDASDETADDAVDGGEVDEPADEAVDAGEVDEPAEDTDPDAADAAEDTDPDAADADDEGEDTDPDAADADDDDEAEVDEDIHLPDVDEDVFGSSEEWSAEAEDFEDDQGDWSHGDYAEVASTLFGDHEFFGESAHDRYRDEGFTQVAEDHPVAALVREHLPDATTFSLFEREGSIVPRGFLTNTALDLLENRFPDLDLSFLRVTVPRRPLADVLPQGSIRPARELPASLLDVTPADSVDLRKYATPIGDQGSTSRCAAFAWTHALEMLGNTHERPLPRLAPSFTMYRFQQLQGDARDFKWAWKGGDGTSGTWQPGNHLFTTGTCRQDYWPDDDKTPAQSLEQMEADAQSHTFDADVYDVDLDDVKKLLTQGLPVQISMATGDAFQDIGRDGVMKVAEAPKGQHGYHAMLCVGYVGNYYIVKNSWGEDWGDQGYCYIPKKVLSESEPEAVAIVPKKNGASPPPAAPTGSTTGAAASAVSAAMRPAAAAAPSPAYVAPPPPPRPRPHFCANCGAALGGGHFCAGCGARHE